MTRVMIVLDAYRVSGLAKGILDFCEATHGRVEPQLVGFQRGGREPTELREECARRGLRAEVLWEHCWLDPSVLIQARRVARSFRPDIVETNGYKADMIGLVLQRWLDLPWVAVSHGVTRGGAVLLAPGPSFHSPCGPDRSRVRGPTLDNCEVAASPLSRSSCSRAMARFRSTSRAADWRRRDAIQW